MKNPLEDPMDRMISASNKRSEKIQNFIASQPQNVFCEQHPHITRQISMEETRKAYSDYLAELKPIYDPCQICANDRAEVELRLRLRLQGVPENLLHATLDNWTPNANEAEFLQCIRAFTIAKRGSLILLGGFGTGKTHLAVGVMRLFNSAFFVKQSTLLRMLRETYSNHIAVDPVVKCQKTDLLILDEMGLTSGGKDELPLLNEILDFRHGARKPTILTGNMDWPGLSEIIGQRLSDRLRESAYRILVFSGKSHRSEAHGRYFE